MAVTASAGASRVMISVYRIYLGRSWVDTGEAAALLALFDALPEFLHTAGSLDEDPETIAACATSQRAAVKVAMTHCHVAVLRAGPDLVPVWTEQEIAAARTGFRWHVPILAVLPPGANAADLARTPVCVAADHVVGWSGIEIARAVQELAEGAAALRRSEIDRIAPPTLAAPAAPPQPEGIVEAQHGRVLPMAEILAAYNELKVARMGRSPGGSM